MRPYQEDWDFHFSAIAMWPKPELSFCYVRESLTMQEPYTGPERTLNQGPYRRKKMERLG